MVNPRFKEVEESIKIFLEFSIFTVTLISIFMALLGLPNLYTATPANTTNAIINQYQQTFQDFHFTYDIFITLILIILSFYFFLLATTYKEEHDKIFWLNYTLLFSGVNIGINLYFISYTILSIYHTYLGYIFLTFFIMNFIYTKNIYSIINEDSDTSEDYGFWYKPFKTPNAIFIYSVLLSTIIGLSSITSTNCLLIAFLHC